MRRMFHFATAFCFLGVCSCNKPPTIPDEVAETTLTSENVNAEQVSRESNEDQATDSPDNVLELVKAFSQRAMPSSEFEAGHAEPIASSELTLESSDQGYVVTFPSGSPIATPTIIGNRVFVSGGFCSESFHCLDLASGKPIWEVRLDDDGPSSGVPCDDLILLSTESCTVFALKQATGELEWSAYLGDPLLSAPASARGKMVVVYPARNDFPEAVAAMVDSSTLALESWPGAASNSRNANLSENRVNPVDKPSDSNRIAELLEPTHIAICLDARTGDVLWRTWIDSDCISAPIIVEDTVYVTSLAGTIYELSISDGGVRSAWKARATSAPLVLEDSIYITRRRNLADGRTQEYLSFLHRESAKQYQAAAPVDAVYLDAIVQMHSSLQDSASGFEQMNGFGGGGFGGGFSGGGNPVVGGGFGGGAIGDADAGGDDGVGDADAGGDGGAGGGGTFGGGGYFQIPDDLQPDTIPPTLSEQRAGPAATDDDGNGQRAIDYSAISDLLGYTEIQAAENIGVGSASTIQGFSGSVTVADSDRLYNTMGNRVVCTSIRDAREIWGHTLEGDLKKLGGHLASPPVTFEDHVYVATAKGDILQFHRDTGHSERLHQLEASFRFRPIVTRDAILVTSQDGRLFYLKRNGKW